MQSNNYLSLSEAAKRSPGRPHAATVWRWARRGVKARSGERIRLEHVRVGGRIFIPADALDRFFKAVSDADAEHFDRRNQKSDRPSPLTRTELQRERDIERAKTTLADAGI